MPRYLLVLLLLLATSHAARASDFTVDGEWGAVWVGRNDVRIPGDTGTRFSLDNDLRTSEPAPYARLRLTWAPTERNRVSLLAAPFSIKSRGVFDSAVAFEGETFAPNSLVEATYRFNSWRATWYYALVHADDVEFGLGLTAKVRDAEIGLKSGSQEAVKYDVGLVPLVHFRLDWRFGDPFGLLVEGDALAAPQGRAEDVLAAVTYAANDHIRLKLGYRLLEGGADNDEVYTFALLHYVATGVIVTF